MDRRDHSLVITTTGLVGGNLYSVLSRKEPGLARTFYPVLEKEPGTAIDITDRSSIEPLFQKVKPGVVFLSAALTNVEYCESHPEESRRINVTGTKNVIDACAGHRAKLVFFSSDYVFDGTRGPYSERDVPNPICVYGRQKLEAETIIASGLDDYLIIRTTVVFGYESARKNFCYRLISTLREGQTISVPSDQVGTPTYAYNLAQVVADLVEHDQRGIFNVVGSDLIDRYAFSLAVCEEFGLDKKLIKPVPTSELGQKARRPLKAGLVIDKVRACTAVPILGVRESLAAFKREFNG